MIAKLAIAGFVLYSATALANDYDLKIYTYVSCLEGTYYSHVTTTTETKTDVSTATFASCATERAQLAAVLGRGSADPLLIEIDAAARNEMTK